jgi:hypothetical protein|tara:strand:- start:1360 stop:1989 length:630 start_codon:yes stop_codon:yes gene_type:complete
MGFKMNKPSMSISYGGESAKQQKSNLMKDNPVAKHASAMQMKQPGYMSADQANELPPELVEAISKKEKAEGKTQPLNNRKVKKAVRKYKKYKKTQAQIEDLEKKGEYSSWRDKGTKKAKRKVKKASKKFDKMREAGSKLSASEKKEAISKIKKESPASMIEEPKKKMLKARMTKKMSCAPGYKKVGEQCIPIKTESAKKKQPTKMYKKH